MRNAPSEPFKIVPLRTWDQRDLRPIEIRDEQRDGDSLKPKVLTRQLPLAGCGRGALSSRDNRKTSGSWVRVAASAEDHPALHCEGRRRLT